MYQRLLVPIDGSPTSERALAEAIAIARMSGGCIRLLHVLDELVFVSGFETGATYLNTVLPQLRQRSERILAAGRSGSCTFSTIWSSRPVSRPAQPTPATSCQRCGRAASESSLRDANASVPARWRSTR